MTHKIYISVGSNIEREIHIASGVEAMAKEFGKLQLSTVFESESVGFDGSPFLNLVVGATTDYTVSKVTEILKHIEAQNGRQRAEKKFAPRTLDLDLLLYDDLITNEGVQLPRDEITYNAFVLQPLAEIAGDVQHPVTGQSISHMWRAYDKSKQKLWPVEFTFHRIAK